MIPVIAASIVPITGTASANAPGVFSARLAHSTKDRLQCHSALTLRPYKQTREQQLEQDFRSPFPKFEERS